MKPLTTRDVADHFGCSIDRIRRLYLHGHLPEPSRFCGRRIISFDDLPEIRTALILSGFVPPTSDSEGTDEAAPAEGGAA